MFFLSFFLYLNLGGEEYTGADPEARALVGLPYRPVLQAARVVGHLGHNSCH